MAMTCEYETLTVKHGGGGFALSLPPTDDAMTAVLNTEGLSGRVLKNAVCPGISQPVILFFQRPR